MYKPIKMHGDRWIGDYELRAMLELCDFCGKMKLCAQLDEAVAWENAAVWGCLDCLSEITRQLDKIEKEL